MDQNTALELIRGGLAEKPGVWADLGAGSGFFTQLLSAQLPGGSHLYALDKSPVLLYNLIRDSRIPLEVIDGDFTRDMPLPLLDGILMANALHYISEPLRTLKHILGYLKAGGRFILVEYDQEVPNPPWNPYPISLQKFTKLSEQLEAWRFEALAQVPARYGSGAIYSVVLTKANS